jgi:hypothetical protein
MSFAILLIRNKTQNIFDRVLGIKRIKLNFSFLKLEKILNNMDTSSQTLTLANQIEAIRIQLPQFQIPSRPKYACNSCAFYVQNC